MEIYKESLMDALATAIRSQEEYERIVLCYTKDSALLWTWKQALETLNMGRELKVKD